MDVRWMAALAGEDTNVAALCRQVGVSRQTFYAWRRRYRLDGADGLVARSRAPLRSPGRISGEVEEAVVALRKELVDLGVDHGPATIQWHLGRRGIKAPSEATIWRVLVRRGFVTPEPRKRPSATRRFEASAPNELWQADAIDWTIASGVVQVLSFIDDHSRVALRVQAVPSATTTATWMTFSQAAARWGLPLGQLTDNGINFSGKLRGVVVQFEANLRAAGVRPITSRPYHPQTCGKVERFQQTLKKWLRRRPLAGDLADLQTHIDGFVDYYNFQRPHRGIGRVTPAARWQATPPAVNLGVALPGPTQQATVKVDTRGIATAHRWQIHLGIEHAGATARVLFDDTHAAVFINDELVRTLALNPNRRYQPSGLSHGRRPNRT